MSAKSRKKLKIEFLRKHPKCCFCGGVNVSDEIDHIPARSLFLDRQWPEGYEFPACVKCNRNSRHAENIVAVISRLSPHTSSRESHFKMKKRFDSLERNYPGILEEMKASAREKKDIVKKYGINQFEELTTKQMPLLKVNGPIVSEALNEFGRKMFLALYYKHTKSILPIEGGIEFFCFSNLQIDAGAIPEEIDSYINEFPELKRNNKDLSDQIFYRYGVFQKDEKAIFLTFFHNTLAMLGLVHRSKTEIGGHQNVIYLEPYKWLGSSYKKRKSLT
ncbi:hypothetical protein OS175_01790 [Marinicella sp. S1101]|uniref:hypothetical protein n=1 Tax=Marinicella marina TaxID=2996016 RepID=UPI002260BFE9|nr:hypothetical protein [Marinicella marina]MCX7552595.1 hypothetical protein [Marinicella marina]MDJ1139471.1 hypothetical protein [Marinicella marina]